MENVEIVKKKRNSDDCKVVVIHQMDYVPSSVFFSHRDLGKWNEQRGAERRVKHSKQRVRRDYFKEIASLKEDGTMMTIGWR